MSWAIQTRAKDRHGEHCVLVQARWLALGSIDGVTMYGGPGVRTHGTAGPTRREMNAFSRPIAGAFDIEEGLENPEVVLEWDDAGELNRESVALTTRHHPSPWRRHLEDAPSQAHHGLRMVLDKHPALALRRHRGPSSGA